MRTLYVAMMANDLLPGEFLPLDQCQGVFVDRFVAAQKIERELLAAGMIKAIYKDLEWQPPLDAPPDDECYRLVHPASDEVFGSIMQVLVERRVPNERRRR